jgi:hypothetical protein
MEQPVNRRRWRRYPLDASVRVVVDHPPVDHFLGEPSAEKIVVDGRGVHFSEGGICLFAAANLTVGSHIKVEFTNPHNDQPVRVRGKIRNRSVYLYGVEFLSDRFEDQQKLARLSDGFRSGKVPTA